MSSPITGGTIRMVTAGTILIRNGSQDEYRVTRVDRSYESGNVRYFLEDSTGWPTNAWDHQLVKEYSFPSSLNAA